MSAIVIRTDASLTIGTGHVMRCLALAEYLRSKGKETLFICGAHAGHLSDLIKGKGFSVSLLPTAGLFQSTGPDCNSDGLGSYLEEDCRQTRKAIGLFGRKIEWLIVDHYAIDQRWESALRPMAKHILVIDDLADRTHDCDLLLDQNLVADMHNRYTGKLPEHCGLMLGSEYALLHPVYAGLHGQVPPRAGPIRRLLVYFGGADSDNVTGRVLTAFLNLGRRDIEVDVVVPQQSPYAPAIQALASGHGNIHLHDNQPTLAQLMVSADLAIGAGGSTSWERCCLGLPALVITIAENQLPLTAALHQQGAVQWLGHKDKVDRVVIESALAQLLDRGLDKQWSLQCQGIVDGKGGLRVASALTTTAASALLARPAGLADETLLLVWANDPTTRKNSFMSEPIPAKTHRHWFQARLNDPDNYRIYIVETEDSIAIGHVRFERKEGEWEINYALAQHFRGRGLGKSMLVVALSKLREKNPGGLLVAKVKPNNQASRKIFEALGFTGRMAGATLVYRHED